MHYWIPGAAVAAVLLSGCSMWPAEEVKDVEQQRVAELKIPQGLTQARQPAQYNLPAKVASGVAPEQLDLRSPVQVLAIATNSRVDEEEKEARVWFERTEFTGDLMPYVQQSIASFFKENSIEGKQSQDLSWQTGWVPEYQETGMWFWKGQELSQEGRFSITLEPRTHGRSIGVRVNLNEMKYADEGKTLTPIAKRREEVHFLNRLIDHMATVELAAIREAKAAQPDVRMTQAVNEAQEAVFVTTQPIDQTWIQLELLFEKVGLEVSDLNQSDYTYFVKYKKAEQGFWDNLWSSESLPELPLGEGEYQLHLSKSTSGTVMRLQDKDGKALDQATMDKVYAAFAAAIRQFKLEL